MSNTPPEQPPGTPPPYGQQPPYAPQSPYGQQPQYPPPSDGQPTYGQQPPYGQAYPRQPKTNGLAIAGFILSLLILPSFIGLILSIVGLIQINNSNGWQTGKGLAIAGIIIGGFWFVIGTLFRFARVFG